MHYQLIRSKRKTLSLQITATGDLQVRAPMSCNLQKIEQFIEEKQQWIEKHQQKMRTKISEKVSEQASEKMHYFDGERFLYLGDLYPLQLSEQNTGLKFDGKNFYLNAQADGRASFLAFYRASFHKIALPRLDYYAKTHRLPFNRMRNQVRIKAQKTRWGSCSGANNINLNYLLMMAPMWVIDYVIVHELAHTLEKNHAPSFWQLVENILPEYRTSERWLKENGYKLHNL